MSGSTDPSEQAETISHSSISEIAPCFNGNISESFNTNICKWAFQQALHESPPRGSPYNTH